MLLPGSYEPAGSLDLFQHGWVLLSEDALWAATAAHASTETGITVEYVHVGTDTRPAEPAA